MQHGSCRDIGTLSCGIVPHEAPWFIFVAVLLLVLVGGAVAAYAYDSSRDDLIAKGVTVAGVDVGGMRTAEATRGRSSASCRSRSSSRSTVQARHDQLHALRARTPA